jgi:hypothetical protein
MNHCASLLLLGTALCGVVVHAQSPAISSTQLYSDTRTGLEIVAGQVSLPADGRWEVKPPDPATGLSELFLEAPPDSVHGFQVQRRLRLEHRRAVEQARQQLNRLYWMCRHYANARNGIGPASFQDLEPNQRQWIERQGTTERFALLPDVRLLDPSGADHQAPARVPFIVEVRPAIADGRHWVLYSDREIERVPINHEWLAQHAIKVQPERELSDLAPQSSDGTVAYRILGRRSDTTSAVVTLELRDSLTQRRIHARWNLDAVQPAGPDLLRDWANRRVARWRALGADEPATTLGWWLRQAPELYGVEPSAPVAATRARSGNTTHAFNVLGGRAAIEETLQLQPISGPETGAATEPRTIPVRDIQGVQVRAHDYQSMLGQADGGRIPLAERIPEDRLFVWFPEPVVVCRFLDAGPEFLFGLSSEFTGRSLDYRLVDRYLARLGLTRDTSRALLESDAFDELALFLPDLHLIDGTDVTVIARLRQPALARVAFHALGLTPSTGITAHTMPNGGTGWLLQQDDLLLIGTHRSELEHVVRLADNRGTGSLGASAEFRYMLTQVPPRATTRAFAYLSDPFIRRLTGPGSKIGQLRRLTARAQLEALSAGALLYQLDHGYAADSAEILFETGYAPVIAGLDRIGFEVDGHGAARSATFGRPGSMPTLLELPVERASQTEAAAYREYRDNYERFWRQFFDPIAIRLDQAGPDNWELETFILPLIDSSIYQGLRRGVASLETGSPLRLPVLDPDPVAMLSANLAEEAWIEAIHDLDNLLVPLLGPASPILEQFGPGIHIAVADSDPVLSLGTGEWFEILGTTGAGEAEGFFLIPAAVSLLTRPTTILVELQDPDAVRAELSRLATGTRRHAAGFIGASITMYGVAREDEWICTLSIEGFITIRVGLSVQDRFLVLSNQPLTHRPRVSATSTPPNNGMNLGLRPEAARLLALSLFASTLEQQRTSAQAGAARLHPLLAVGTIPIEVASSLHHELYGFAPLHPAGGTFEWTDGMVSSSLFGPPNAQRLPLFDMAKEESGLLRGVPSIRLNLQFEQDGLRVGCAWSTELRH